jgi:hypothetical protein
VNSHGNFHQRGADGTTEFFRSDCQDARFGRSGPCFVAAISSGIPRRTTPCQVAPFKRLLDGDTQAVVVPAMLANEREITSASGRSVMMGEPARTCTQVASSTFGRQRKQAKRHSIRETDPSYPYKELFLREPAIL